MCRFFFIFIPFLYLSGCVAINDDSYPSKYIGIFNQFERYTNGKIPSTKQNYSGFWQKKFDNGNIYIEGSYLNGIPIGIWKGYYINGSLREAYSYYLNGRFTAIEYFPDGMPRRKRAGIYQFIDDEYSISIDEKEEWYWDLKGNIQFDVNSSFLHDTVPKPAECDYMYPYLLYEQYQLESWIEAKNNDFYLKIFLIPRVNEQTGKNIQIFEVKGEWDDQEQKVVYCSITTYGDCTLVWQGSSIKRDPNVLWFNFNITSPTTEEPLGIKLGALLNQKEI